MKTPNFTPEQIRFLTVGAQAMLAPDDDLSSPAENSKSGKTRNYQSATNPDKIDSSLQEWARWNSLTSGEEGWTGQNEPMDSSERVNSEAKTYLVRHGSTEMNSPDPEKDRIRGHKDVPLSKKGREESEQTAEQLADSGIKTIITSDLSRASDTADAIAEKTGAKVIEDAGLRPWHFGSTIEGKKTSDMLPKIKKLVENPDEVPPGGESFNQFKSRFLDTFHKYQDKYPDENTALVTHFRGVKLLEAWRATGVDNDEISKEIFEEYSNKEKPAFFQVLDKSGNLVADKPT